MLMSFIIILVCFFSSCCKGPQGPTGPTGHAVADSNVPPGLKTTSVIVPITLHPFYCTW